MEAFYDTRDYPSTGRGGGGGGNAGSTEIWRVFREIETEYITAGFED